MKPMDEIDFTAEEKDIIERVLSSHPMDDAESAKMFIAEALPDRYELVDVTLDKEEAEGLKEYLLGDDEGEIFVIEMKFFTSTGDFVYSLYVLVKEK